MLFVIRNPRLFKMTLQRRGIGRRGPRGEDMCSSALPQRVVYRAEKRISTVSSLKTETVWPAVRKVAICSEAVEVLSPEIETITV